jgi:hypothetical protein
MAMLREWARARAINRRLIRLHPPAGFIQALHARLRNQPFAGRSHIEQVIAAFAGAVDEIADEGGGGFPILVMFVVAPMAVHRHARFPIDARHPHRGDFLFRRAVVARQFFEAVKIVRRFWPAASLTLPLTRQYFLAVLEDASWILQRDAASL